MSRPGAAPASMAGFGEYAKAWTLEGSAWIHREAMLFISSLASVSTPRLHSLVLLLCLEPSNPPPVSGGCSSDRC
jgi:hypothetical protein